MPNTSKTNQVQNDYKQRPRCQSRHSNLKKCEVSLFKENKKEKENEPFENKILKLANEMHEKAIKQTNEEAKYKMYYSYFEMMATLLPVLSPALKELKYGCDSYISYLTNECKYQSDKYNKCSQKYALEVKELEKDKETLLKEVVAQQKQMELQATQLKHFQQNFDATKENYQKQIEKLKYLLNKSNEENSKIKEIYQYGKPAHAIDESYKSESFIETKPNTKTKLQVPSLDFSKLRKKNDELKLIVKPTVHASCDSESDDLTSLNKTTIEDHKAKPKIPKLDLNFLRKKVGNNEDYHNEFMSKVNDFSKSWKDLLMKESKS
jgi:hypothetical protein